MFIGMDLEMSGGSKHEKYHVCEPPFDATLQCPPGCTHAKGDDLPKNHAKGDEIEKLYTQKIVNLVPQHNAQILEELGGVSRLILLLNSNAEKGINDDLQEIDKRRRLFGSNHYSSRPTASFCNPVKTACKDIPLVLLLLCGLTTLGLKVKIGDWHDAVSMPVVILLIIFIKSFVIYMQKLQFLNLKEKPSDIMVEVIRGGRTMQLSLFDVVVGDIVYLKVGDQVPADGLVIDGRSLYISQVGSELIHVSPDEPFLFCGSKVCYGHGSMVVTGIGNSTNWGQLMAELLDADCKEETLLQSTVRGGVILAGKLGAFLSVVVFAAAFIRHFIAPSKGSGDSWSFKLGHTSAVHTGETFLDIIGSVLILVVVTVPEGLPLAISFGLAHAKKSLMANNVLTRRLGAFETMGHVTSICTDITGSLTLNEMVVTKAWVAGGLRDTATDLQNIDQEHQILITEGLVFTPRSDGEPEVTGSPIEKAALLWGLQSGLNYEHARAQSTVLQVESFNSTKQIAGVALRIADSGKVHVHWKGAAEAILDRCDTVVGTGNLVMQMSASEKQEISSLIEGMSAEGLQCIAFSCMQVDEVEISSCERLEEWKIPEQGLTLLAIVGIKDPCRPEAPEAIRQCQAAGIKVRMITGDSIARAKAIATNCGILKDGDLAVEAFTVQNPTNATRKRLMVIARSSPADKLMMIRTLREKGELVAITGVGGVEINDRSSLRESDVGLSLGIQGTEVANENSDIIIMDDNFASVVRIIGWSRALYLNTRKILQFQLAPILTIVVMNGVSVVYTGDLSLTITQLLWLSLIVVNLGMLALAREPPSTDILVQPPVNINDPLISNIMWRNLLLQFFYQVSVLFLLQYRGTHLLKLKGGEADEVNRTILFNVLVFCQLFNVVNARESEEMNIFRGILRSRLLLVVVSCSVVLQVMLVEVVGNFASTVKLSWQYWVFSVVIGFLSWPIALLGKFIHVPKRLVFDGSYNKARQRHPKIPRMS